MEENLNRIPEEQYDEIDLMELLRKLIKNWKMIFKWCCIAAVVGLVFAISSIKSYTVSTSMAPEMTRAGSSSSLSSLASLAGVNLNSNSSNALFPELYPSIIGSTHFVSELFAAPVEFTNKKKESISTDYYTYLKEYTKATWYSYVLSAPMKALSWFIGLFKEKEEKIEGFANLNPDFLTKEQYKILNGIKENINLVVDKKTNEISLSVTAQNPVVAFQVSQYVIAKLKEYITEYRTEKARNDVEYYEQLFDEAKADYYQAQQTYAQYVDANQNVVLQRVRIEQERLQNEMNLSYSLYNSCAQQLQVAKAKLQQETPVFVVIAPPTVPLKASSMSRLMILIVVTFLGFCCACVWILFLKEKIAEFKAGGITE